MDYEPLIITGPTASGKTSYSIKKALEENGEIICCDSMQIYKKMDIGTAKATAEERAAVPHHMLDFVEPWEEYSVADYCKAAETAYKDILSRGKTPVFVGGTGLYVTSIVEGYSYAEEEEEDAKLRAQLENTDAEILYAFLKENDPEAAAITHVNNKKRIIRYVELFKKTGLTYSERAARSKSSEPFFKGKVIAVKMDRERLVERINLRVDMMIKEGLVEETEELLRYCRSAGRMLSKTALQAIGYRETMQYLAGEISKEEMADKIKVATRQYAKRQMTWLRKWPWVEWVEM